MAFSSSKGDTQKTEVGGNLRHIPDISSAALNDSNRTKAGIEIFRISDSNRSLEKTIELVKCSLSLESPYI